MNPAHFTTHAAALVAANDRRTRRRALLRAIRRRLHALGLVWSAFLVAGFVLWVLPVNMRAAG